ncbi:MULTISPECIES: histone-like nucleoid-structuring protein Lsr2 [Embleya]|uniref:Lsr2 family protein n=1 Tax=Embleya hyalina TaxID=516124 RepID=A0A401YIG5_9ACTN|nr:Lsr2 family protein [Embleya hyalina]WSY40694.1 Lsr2 family protein [Embleya sp. NBC_00888]GCD94412.1 Lsr2 family protein [Embleya hyalina]
MAQRVVVSLHDDIDGSEATETIRFGLDGKSYEIDLSEEHVQQMRDALAPYLAVARRTARTGKPFRQTTVTSDPAAVRAWARARGMDVPARGRIPARVYAEFEAANTAN